jgi:hypothetical protein
MAAVEARLAGLSGSADILLKQHRHLLFQLGLSITFNRSTLATKYWLPLPKSDDSVSRTDVNTAVSRDGNAGERLARALEKSIECLEKFDAVATQMCGSTGVQPVIQDTRAPSPTSSRE